MQNSSSDLERSQRDYLIGWGLHLFTATGVFCALFSILAVYDQKPRLAIGWLLISLVIDGVDGPIARKINIKRTCSIIDGDLLDLVVDYLTFILIPALFMLEFNMFPSSVEIPMTAMLLFVGALWSARTDMKSEDKWFNGFPAAWNFLAISLWLVGTTKWTNVVVMSIFMVLSATTIKFFHIFRSQQFRAFTVSFTCLYLLAITFMITFDDQLDNIFGRAIIVGWFSYYLALAAWRTAQDKKQLHNHETIS